MHACTVVARNFLAQVRVLAESFTAVHPASDFTVLVVDGEPDERFDEDAPYVAVTPTEIGMDPAAFAQMATVYDVTELSTALKPVLLDWLLAEHGVEVVAYLDPDMVVYDRLDEAEELARRHGIVLVPHVLQPFPRDSLTIDEQAILVSGIFNLGFVAVDETARPFLRWWGERTRWDGCYEPAAGMFGDQRWIDFVPTLFDHVVWRDPGVDVAYWNLHERPLTRDDAGHLLAAGEPLRALHLSGYCVERPYVLSKHQGSRPRVRLSRDPLLAELVADYRDSLFKAGVERWSAVPYRFGSLAGGPFPLDVRRLARAAWLDPLAFDPPPAPFGPRGGEDAFLAWLNRPVVRKGTAVLTRLLWYVWNRRTDLQTVFRQPLGADLEALVAWSANDDFCRAYGHLTRQDQNCSVEAHHRPPSAAEPLPVGLNVVGYLNAEVGVGEAGRLMALAADAAGLPHQPIAYHVTPSRQLDPFASRSMPTPPARPYSVSLLCVNANCIASLLSSFPPDSFADSYRVGLWFWEVDQAPEETHEALGLVDEVWVTSEYVADVFRPHTDKPVLVAPLAVIRPVPTCLEREDLGLPRDRFVFLSCFDSFSVPARKNPDGVIAAYRQAFGPDDGAHLVIKAINGDQRAEAMERLWYLAQGRPDIEIRDGYLSRAEMSALVQHSDAYVSLHRSEGFGLLPAAAMAAGKPVIATAYSGNRAFMNAHNSLLVPYGLVDVGPGNEPYPATARWAEPDVAAAAQQLARVVADPVLVQEIGARARREIEASHGVGVAGAWLARRVDEIMTRSGPTRSSR